MRFKNKKGVQELAKMKGMRQKFALRIYPSILAYRATLKKVNVDLLTVLKNRAKNRIEERRRRQTEQGPLERKSNHIGVHNHTLLGSSNIKKRKRMREEKKKKKIRRRTHAHQAPKFLPNPPPFSFSSFPFYIHTYTHTHTHTYTYYIITPLINQ